MSPRTEEAYAGWIRRFIVFHSKRHPADMGPPEVERFLSSLATQHQVAASTQNQALQAILFLYRDVLRRPLGMVPGIVRARTTRHLPVVLSRSEVRAVLERLAEPSRLVAHLLYGAGLRLSECLDLRVKDVDFTARQITIRDDKGGKEFAATSIAWRACTRRTSPPDLGASSCQPCHASIQMPSV